MTVFETLLNNTFTISRIRRTPDGSGGWAIDYVTQGSIVGRIRPASSRERELAAREEREITHVFYATYPADVVRGDRLQVRDLTFEVQGVREPSLAGEHVEVDCLLRQYEEVVSDGS